MRTDRLFRALSSMARRLPQGVLYAIADLTAAGAFLLCRSRRRAALANFTALARATGAAADAPARARALTREAFRSHHRLAFEFLRAAALPADSVRARVSFEGMAHLARANASGRGAILATVHTGNWQLAGLARADLGARAHTVAGTQFHRALSDAARRAEERSGVCVHGPRRAVAGLAGALRRGEIVLLQLDGGFIGRGISARVFGRDVRLARGVLALARRTGAPVLPASMQRTGHFRFRVEFGDPLSIASCDDAGAAAVMAREIERQVLAAPGQWALFRDLAADVSSSGGTHSRRREPRRSGRRAGRERGSRLKVALITQSYYPVLGGVSEHVHSLAGALTRRGHDVTIVTPRWATRAPRGGVRVVHLGRGLAVPFHGAQSQIAVGWRLGAGLRRTLGEGGFDIVHVHSPLVPTLPLLALRSRSARVVGTFHTAGETAPYRVASPLLRRFTRTLDAGIAVSEPARAFAEQFYDGPLSIIPNGVDVERFHPNGDRPRTGPMRLLYVGRFEPRKGHAILLDAFAAIEARSPGRATLVLVGDGPLDRALRARAARMGSGCVRFEGAVAPEDLPSVYRASDLFVAPALRNESFGIVLLEAMASGLPIVASDIPGYREVVGDAAVLFPPGDETALAAALEGLLDDGVRRLSLSAAGLARAEEHRWSDVAARVDELYASTLIREER